MEIGTVYQLHQTATRPFIFVFLLSVYHIFIKKARAMRREINGKFRFFVFLRAEQSVSEKIILLTSAAAFGIIKPTDKYADRASGRGIAST
jgi:hypothetical protein